ncbi:MAG: hypothetical protein GY822_25550 [Deltaproteobacteria bacterium]|nr:hypothetical protein [Deltaproteobacteria bacterium]
MALSLFFVFAPSMKVGEHCRPKVGPRQPGGRFETFEDCEASFWSLPFGDGHRSVQPVPSLEKSRLESGVFADGDFWVLKTSFFAISFDFALEI